MKCNECGHDLAEHRLYGCDAGAEDEAEKARLFDIIEQRTRNGQWTVRASGPDYVGVYLHNTGETIEAPTLAEAVTKGVERSPFLASYE